MTDVTYKDGMTSVWSDGEKLKITNPAGRKHIPINIDRLFGAGSYDEIINAAYSNEANKKSVNPYATEIEIISGFIPKKVQADLSIRKSSGTTETDYFE